MKNRKLVRLVLQLVALGLAVFGGDKLRPFSELLKGAAPAIEEAVSE